MRRQGRDRPVVPGHWYAIKHGASILLACILLGCSSSVPAEPPSDVGTLSTAMSPTNQPLPLQAANSGQSLPLSARINVADQTIQLEVARTAAQQEIGLMYRTELATDRGMVFPFEPPRRVGFWMKNTLIPLDMVFLLKGKVQAISNNVQPCTTDPCPIYGPNALVDQVIELRAGRAHELGLKQGDRLLLQQP